MTMDFLHFHIHLTSLPMTDSFFNMWRNRVKNESFHWNCLLEVLKDCYHNSISQCKLRCEINDLNWEAKRVIGEWAVGVGGGGHLWQVAVTGWCMSMSISNEEHSKAPGLALPQQYLNFWSSCLSFISWMLTSHTRSLSQLFCPNGISPMGNSGCLPSGKPAAAVMLPILGCMMGVSEFP